MRSRCSAVMAWLTPPGRPQTGWICLPPIMLMTSAASARSLIMAPAVSRPTLPMTPRMLRAAGVALRPHDEVRAGEDVEVRRVVGHVERVVEQLAQLAAGGRDLDAEHVVDGLGGRHVVSLRAHAADARRDARQLLDRAADAEALEAAQLGDLEVDVLDLVVVVDEDLDLAVTLETGDGIDGYLFHADLGRGDLPAATNWGDRSGRTCPPGRGRSRRSRRSPRGSARRRSTPRC